MCENTQLTPLMAQYVAVKEQYKDDVLFFRLGDFYEMFYQDAIEISRLLNLTLTHRQQTPMCGIPYHAAKVYIARLLRFGKKIVICEQVGEIPRGNKGIAERKVVEIITPGTAVESEYLNGSVNNYLAALSVTHGKVGFAYIDVTTAAFSATSWPASQMAENFSKELGRCIPREILLPLSLKNNQDIQISLSACPELSVSYYPDWQFSLEISYKKLISQFKTVNLHSFSLDENSAEVVPAGFLLEYLEKTTNTNIPHVSSIRVYHDSDYVIMDDSSRRNLEIVSNLRDGSAQFSLLECVNHTMTAMGNRLIRSWLLSPLTDCKKIQTRQEHVSLFSNDRALLKKIREELSPILDIERLAGRVAMDRAHAKDLQALRSSLENWLEVRKTMMQYDFAQSDESISQEIVGIIKNSITEDPATSITDGRIIKDGWSAELDHLRQVQSNFNQILDKYLEEEKAKTGITTLRVKNTNSSGYCLEVTKGKLSAVPSHFIMRRSLLNAERYTTTKLQELEKELTEAGSRIVELERDLFLEVRNKLKTFVPYLLQTSKEIAYADVSASLAQASILNNWVCPELDDSKIFTVHGGRHPVVELHLPTGEFIPNDLTLCASNQSSSKEDNSVFALITGPNMAGKSTYLRQNALICLLAQIGSFVPATHAHLGIVDRIFCRVGASDNLARGESTFLVEMTETAHILRSATEKSLVIMDEVGRGTSTEDGLSIAWAVSEYLLNTIKCKTLFATHYHELTRMEHEHLCQLCMDVDESGGTINFLRKIKKGSAENSYGIHVARLAGIPQSVIDRANEVLSHIQSLAQDKPLLLSEKTQTHTQQSDITQNNLPQFKAPNLFSDEEMLLDEILSSNTDEMTPLQALQTIIRWKKTLSGK